jgi:hypothetical protein
MRCGGRVLAQKAARQKSGRPLIYGCSGQVFHILDVQRHHVLVHVVHDPE